MSLLFSPANSAFYQIRPPRTEDEIKSFYLSRFSWLPFIPGWPAIGRGPRRNTYTVDLAEAYANPQITMTLQLIIGPICYGPRTQVLRYMCQFLHTQFTEQEGLDQQQLEADPDWHTRLLRFSEEQRIRAIAARHGIVLPRNYFDNIPDLDVIIHDVLPPGEVPSPSPSPSPTSYGTYSPERPDWSD